MSGYRYAVRHAKAQLGERRLTSLTPLDFQRLYHPLAEQGLAASTIRQVHVVCRQVLTMAVDYDLLVSNPILRAKPPRIHNAPIERPTPIPKRPSGMSWYCRGVDAGKRWGCGGGISIGTKRP
jgi:hypothetical protein